ncbi:MAG: hypothetical protein VX589_18955 [Myxococcota bacterium]|nr:hypothetical protein [Myxococcota bacterium]
MTKSRPITPSFRGWRHLLWAQWRSLRNGTEKARGKERVRLLFFGGLALLFMLGMGFGAFWLFRQFLNAEFLAELLIRRVLDITLLFFCGLLIFSNLIGGFTTLLLAEDMMLLMSVPIPPGRLYAARLCQTWSQSSWMMLVFALPMFAAVGPVLAAPWWFYPTIPLVLLPLTVMCAAVGTATTLTLARWLPAHRMRDILVILAIIGFLAVYIAFRLAEPERFLEPDGFEDLVSLIANLRGGESPWVPTVWAIDILTQSARNETAGLGLAFALLFGGAASAVTVSTWLARRILTPGFMTAQEGQVARHRSDSAQQPTANTVKTARYPNGVSSAIRQRDLKIFLRTTGQWTQLLLVGALVVVYLFNFKHFRALQDSGLLGPLGIFFINYALGGLVVTTLVARFLYPSVSLEGRAYWAIQVAPMYCRDLLKGKVQFGLFPLLAVAAVLAIGSGLITGLPNWMLVSSLSIGGITSIALIGLGVGMGGIWPQFHLDNPTRIASGLGGVLFMLLGIAYLVATAFLVGWPLGALQRFFETGFIPRPTRIWQFAGLVLGAIVLSVITYAVPMRMGAKSLEHRDG